MRLLTFSIIFCSIFIANTQKINGQSYFPDNNGESLKSITEFDAIVSISVWLDVEDDRARFNSNLQNAFELGLRRDGVIIDQAAGNYLICEIKAAQAGGIVAYTYDVLFYEFNFNGLNLLLWSSGGMVTVGKNNFNYKEVANKCVNIFSNEWLKQNPRK